jgi:hypothetical protein
VNDLPSYLKLIVEPTFEEFKDDPTPRRAFLTCLAIYHAIDRVSYPKSTSNLRKAWGKKSIEFKLVDIIAHHLEHVKSMTRKELARVFQSLVPSVLMIWMTKWISEIFGS